MEGQTASQINRPKSVFGKSHEFEHIAEDRIRVLMHEAKDTRLRITRAQTDLADKETRLRFWLGALRDYRDSLGMPTDDLDRIVVVEDEYDGLPPTAMALLWAKNHGGDVVVKEAAQVALRSGTYKDYRHAYNAISAVVKRHRRFHKVAIGHYRAAHPDDLPTSA